MRRWNVCVAAAVVSCAATACANSSESELQGGGSGNPTPAAAMEDSDWDAVQLTFVNKTDAALAGQISENCDGASNYSISAGMRRTWPASSCPGLGSEDIEGTINGYTFTVNNPWLGDVSAKFQSIMTGEGSLDFSWKQNEPSAKIGCVAGLIVRNTAYTTAGDGTREVEFTYYSPNTAVADGIVNQTRADGCSKAEQLKIVGEWDS